MDIVCPQCKTKLTHFTSPAFCEHCGFTIERVNPGFLKSIWRFCFVGTLERRIGVLGASMLLILLLMQLWRAVAEAFRSLGSH